MLSYKSCGWISKTELHFAKLHLIISMSYSTTALHPFVTPPTVFICRRRHRLSHLGYCQLERTSSTDGPPSRPGHVGTIHERRSWGRDPASASYHGNPRRVGRLHPRHTNRHLRQRVAAYRVAADGAEVSLPGPSASEGHPGGAGSRPGSTGRLRRLHSRLSQDGCRRARPGQKVR